MLVNYLTMEGMWKRKALGCAVVLVFMSGSFVSSQQSTVQAPSSAETPFLAEHSEYAVMVAEPQTFPLWKNGAPGTLGTSESDQPTLTFYAPVNGTGTAIVVAPGGGYSFVATNHEGRWMANWLNALGIAAFVLKYRVGPRYHHPIELGDAQRALRLVRSRATEFGARPNRIRSATQPRGNYGLLRGRPLGVDTRNPLRRRKSRSARSHRPRRLQAGFRHPGICSHLFHGTLHTSRVGDVSAWQESRSQDFEGTLQRTASDVAHSSHVFVQYGPGPRRTAGEQHCLLLGTAQSGRTSGVAHF
jgi:hypothetical protein